MKFLKKFFHICEFTVLQKFLSKISIKEVEVPYAKKNYLFRHLFAIFAFAIVIISYMVKYFTLNSPKRKASTTSVVRCLLSSLG